MYSCEACFIHSLLWVCSRMWDMVKQTKMAAAVCNSTFAYLLVPSTGFDGWGSSKDQMKDKRIVFISVFDCCSQTVATLRSVADNEAAKLTTYA